ncbi:acyltransferase family protein [Actinospongicola halichondriae]|uniref:acyltransferase family protein n=1 Tax=Actinospongicola halichondriae TaxID=3236844 RepID=UPI003D5B63CD
MRQRVHALHQSRAPQRRLVHRRLAHTHALDGLRALALVGVLLYHHEAGLAQGGWLGVSLFFTLSGFLIAGLLLAEFDETGTIRLRTFWERRIRRLVPASLLAVGLAVVVVFLSGIHTMADAAPDLRAAVLNVANWRFVFADVAYAGADVAPSPVKHYWSLAIEEQFYLVLPLLAVVALRRGWFGRVVLAVVGLSLASTLFSGGGLDRLYFGTDTRAAELAVGVGLAIAWPHLCHLIADRTWLADVWGIGSVIAAVLLFRNAVLEESLLRHGGLIAVTVVWVGLIVAAVLGRWVPRALSLPGLPALGRVSYGAYLFHWPVYVLFTSPRTGLAGTQLLAVRLAVTLVLAVGSAAVVEMPIRRGAIRPRLLVPALGTAIAATVAFSVVTGVPKPQSELASLGILEPPTVSTSIATTVPTSGPTDRPTGSTPAPTTPVTDGAAPPTPSTTVAPAPVAPASVRVPRILVLGDSTAGFTGRGLQKAAAQDGTAEIYVLNDNGCTVLPYAEAIYRAGMVTKTSCHDIIGQGVAAVDKVDPDLIVVFLGSAQLVDARFDDLVGVHSILEEKIRTRYRRALGAAVADLDALGIPVLWADLPPVEWDVEAFNELTGASFPGVGPVSTNDPARAATLNRIDADVIGAARNVRRWDYTAGITGPDGTISLADRPDGLHLAPAAATRIARESLLPRLTEAFRRLVGDSSATLAPREPTTWHQVGSAAEDASTVPGGALPS